MAPRKTIAICKFVGSISLGLLTGVSYTLSAIAIPALLTLPSAQTAQHTLLRLRSVGFMQLRALSAVSAGALLLAYGLSPAHGRHPYLLWTALTVALSAGSDAWLSYGARWVPASSPAAARSFLHQHSLHRTSPPPPPPPPPSSLSSPWSSSSSPSSSSSSPQPQQQQASQSAQSQQQPGGVFGAHDQEQARHKDDDAAVAAAATEPNGEEVLKEIQRTQTAQAVRGGVAGLGFLMSIVGIWGDGY